ncbi:MAG: hypothetical protein ACI8V4_002220 [Ilumatobacter sp.]|jgi:hypothetical protein
MALPTMSGTNDVQSPLISILGSLHSRRHADTLVSEETIRDNPLHRREISLLTERSAHLAVGDRIVFISREL